MGTGWAPPPGASPGHGPGATGRSTTVPVGVWVALVIVLGLLVGGGIGWALTRDDSEAQSAPATSTGRSDPATTQMSATTSTSTTSTTTAPTTTTTVSPWVPAGTPADVSAAYDTAQRLANALAVGDWSTARAMQPDKASNSDSTFAAGYGDLEASRAVLVRWDGSGRHTLRLGLVAHQRDGNTQLYCVSWSVDAAAGTVRQLPEPADAIERLAGWPDPSTLTDLLRSRC